MNSFDLCITAVGVPSNFGMSAGSQAMREVTTMQEGSEHSYGRVLRALSEPRELLRRIADRLFDRGTKDPSTLVFDGNVRPAIEGDLLSTKMRTKCL